MQLTDFCGGMPIVRHYSYLFQQQLLGGCTVAHVCEVAMTLGSPQLCKLLHIWGHVQRSLSGARESV